jgi:outer membrane biosynthesis protein TonB
MSGMREIIYERPDSLLTKRWPSAGTLVFGSLFALSAHLFIPLVLLASQWLLVLLGLAIPVEDKPRVKLPDNLIAAEFVKLGKPFDPTKLPNRKVPPIAKRKPTGVVVSKDARENPEPKPEEKDKPKDSQESMLDNLVDRTKEFAEDVEPQEEEGDPQGIAEGTATTAKAGNLYLGQLVMFFRRGWTIPNLVQNAEDLKATAAIQTSADGKILSVEIQQSSGNPLFDQSIIDRVDELIASSASIPEPPPELRDAFYAATLPVRFNGAGVR